MSRPTAIVVGTGAGGATTARELQGTFDVTVLEAGGAFAPFRRSLRTLERIRATGLLFDEREIQLVFPHMRVHQTNDLVLVNGQGLGGTTTIATGNALRVDGALRAIGIDLNAEFAELEQDIPISTDHQGGWRDITKCLFHAAEELGLSPFPTPKMGDYAHCAHCGRCVFGCPLGVKWDSRRFLEDAVVQGAAVHPNTPVERVEIEQGGATGVWTKNRLGRHFHPADLVVLAAGGLGTAPILERSGIPCEPHLFVDPVLCVAAPARGCRQCHELQMPFVIQRDGYIVSPYFDYLSFLFNRDWRQPAEDIVGLMIKIADSEAGYVEHSTIEKVLTARDRERLREGVMLCNAMLAAIGVDPGQAILGTINAGHPGGTLPLTEREAVSLHHDRLPANLYVADASLLPRSLGSPPSLTIMALAKRIARRCVEAVAAAPDVGLGSHTTEKRNLVSAH